LSASKKDQYLRAETSGEARDSTPEKRSNGGGQRRERKKKICGELFQWENKWSRGRYIYSKNRISSPGEGSIRGTTRRRVRRKKNWGQDRSSNQKTIEHCSRKKSLPKGRSYVLRQREKDITKSIAERFVLRSSLEDGSKMKRFRKRKRGGGTNKRVTGQVELDGG